MTIKELLVEEIETTPSEILEDIFSFLKLVKTTPMQNLSTYKELLERIDYLEAIVGIRKGLEEYDRGEGIPANQALATLQHKLGIPLRP